METAHGTAMGWGLLETVFSLAAQAWSIFYPGIVVQYTKTLIQSVLKA